MGVQKEHFWERHVSANYNVSTTFPAHAADECIRHREECQDGDVVFCQITLDTSLFYCTSL